MKELNTEELAVIVARLEERPKTYTTEVFEAQHDLWSARITEHMRLLEDAREQLLTIERKFYDRIVASQGGK